MEEATLTRMAAFAEQPGGGNPAGVWIGPALPDEAEMQRLAEQIGYSETAFLSPLDGDRWQVRYFSPKMEVPFCGHATIASGVVLGERLGAGRYRLQTPVGEVPVEVELDSSGALTATLTSVAPSSRQAPKELVSGALRCLGWSQDLLNPELPPHIAFAGASHLVLALRQREDLASLDYAFDDLAGLMRRHDLITLQLVWRQNDVTFHVRNPFPVGGVVEDPATGAAAAALGGYLRQLGAVSPPTRLTLYQGEDMGRPSVLHLEIPPDGGIRVQGRGLAIGE